MLCANAAHFFEAVAQLLSRAMKPNGQVVLGDSEARRDWLGILAIQVESPDECCVFRLERWNQPLNTCARHAFLLVGRRRINFRLKLFEGALAHITSAVKVNNRAAQDAVEPRFDALVITDLICASERLEQAFLHGIGRECGLTQTSAGELEELVQAAGQLFCNVFHHSS